MLTVHSIPDAFSVMECDRIVTALAAAPSKDALLVGKVQDNSFRISDLVWMDDVSGAGWIMDRLIDLVRRSNSNIFDFDLREFAESPQAATYQAAKSGHFAWHSDIVDGPTARKRKLTLVLQLNTPEVYDGGDLEIMSGTRVVRKPRTRLRQYIPQFFVASSHARNARRTSVHHRVGPWPCLSIEDA